MFLIAKLQRVAQSSSAMKFASLTKLFKRQLPEFVGAKRCSTTYLAKQYFGDGRGVTQYVALL